MIKIYINNKIVFVPKNTSILEACEEIGIQLPRFCYHERLNVAGNCRMCLVEVEKTPKPIAACAFPVVPEMRVFTDTPLVKKARENVLELLLINHPLDCPICDQGGECDLQEQSFHYGTDRSRFIYTKRAVQDKVLGPLIKTIMNRCIHCTRCVRFFQDIVGNINFGTVLRGKSTEISSYIKSNLNSEISGNVIDLCPVGALTSKPYAFLSRPWELKSIETIDVLDSIGSNIRVDVKETNIMRIVPSQNDSLNQEWISNAIRFSFDGLKTQRILNPFIKNKNIFLKQYSWYNTLKQIYLLKESLKPSEMTIICGNSVDLESMLILKKITQNLNIPLISEQFLDSSNNILTENRFNTNFLDIMESDLCLTIGTNLRVEATILNIRIKNRSIKGNFIKASIGLADNFSYQNLSIGNSMYTLIELLEGRHFFCKKLIKSKTPLIILGSTLQKRLDYNFVLNLLDFFKKTTNIVGNNWFGLNILPLFAGTVGLKTAGINTKSILNFKKIKGLYLIGLESYDMFNSISLDSNLKILVQTPFSDSFFKKSNIIIPSLSFLEKDAFFLNLEGRLQKTNIVLKNSTLARTDADLLSVFFNSNFKKKKLKITNFNNFMENRFSFLKNLNRFSQTYFKKVFKTSFKGFFSSIYLTGIITKNSLIMSKCFLSYKQNYSNFI